LRELEKEEKGKRERQRGCHVAFLTAHTKREYLWVGNSWEGKCAGKIRQIPVQGSVLKLRDLNQSSTHLRGTGRPEGRGAQFSRADKRLDRPFFFRTKGGSERGEEISQEQEKWVFAENCRTDGGNRKIWGVKVQTDRALFPMGRAGAIKALSTSLISSDKKLG